MPQPKPGESKNDYLQRCIPQLIHEGRQQDQAIAICYSMYDRHTNHKNKKRENLSKRVNKTKLYMMYY